MPTLRLRSGRIFNDTIHIDAPPARVWQVLANAEQFDLQSADTREQVTSVQKQGVETQMRVVRRVGPFVIVLKGRIAEWEEASTMTSEWSSGLPFAIATRVRMELVPESAGTRLDRDYNVQVKLPVIGNAVAAFLARNTPSEMHRLMERIKQAAEKG
jgi:carbon monoxide dehydrogenase subunit G